MGRHNPATFGKAPGSIPPQVAELPRREKEVALILYSEGPMTGRTVHARLQRDLSYSALRSMLMRLCRKRVLQRRKISGSHDPRDRRIPYVYAPAITDEAVRQHALLQLARDYFDGSLDSLFHAAARAVHRDHPGREDDLRLDVAA